MKSLNQYISENNESVNESLADIFTQGISFLFGDFLQCMAVSGLVITGSVFLNMVNKTIKTNEEFRDLRSNVILTSIFKKAKDNPKCPEYNKYFDDLAKLDNVRNEIIIQYLQNKTNIGIRSYNIIKELVGICDTNEEKDALKELIDLSIKQSTKLSNIFRDDKSTLNKEQIQDLKDIKKNL